MSGLHQLRRPAMRKYLKAYEGVFNSAAIPVLVDAFDEAWKAVQDSDAINATEAARVALAKYIVDAALISGCDHRRLCDDALQHLAEVSPVTTTPRV
jgi:hypothetical protein